MNEKAKSESLSPPRRIEIPLKRKPIKREILRGLLTGVGTAILAGGAIFTLMVASTTSTRGSTRSAKLRWQQRQAEIDQAIAQENQSAAEKAQAHDGNT